VKDQPNIQNGKGACGFPCVAVCVAVYVAVYYRVCCSGGGAHFSSARPTQHPKRQGYMCAAVCCLVLCSVWGPPLNNNSNHNINLVWLFLGRTALHWAAANGTASAVDCLLRAGANQRIRNRDGMTPLELANHFNNSQTIAVLRGHANLGKAEDDVAVERVGVWGGCDVPNAPAGRRHNKHLGEGECSVQRVGVWHNSWAHYDTVVTPNDRFLLFVFLSPTHSLFRSLSLALSLSLSLSRSLSHAPTTRNTSDKTTRSLALSRSLYLSLTHTYTHTHTHTPPAGGTNTKTAHTHTTTTAARSLLCPPTRNAEARALMSMGWL